MNILRRLGMWFNPRRFGDVGLNQARIIILKILSLIERSNFGSDKTFQRNV